jgi:acetyltransferase-like isoleucine patch superfamily enzyme
MSAGSSEPPPAPGGRRLDPALRALIAAVDWLDDADVAKAPMQSNPGILVEHSIYPPHLPQEPNWAPPLLIGRNSVLLAIYGGQIGSRTAIGRYCTIGRRVDIGANPHPITELASGFLSPRFHEEFTKGIGEDDQAITVIGCDVWIGMSVFIRGGVRIGHGAVLQPGAVVVKDVPPYAIVAGSPARVSGERFSPAIVDRLLASRWWTLPEAVVADLPAGDVHASLGHAERWRDTQGPPR